MWQLRSADGTKLMQMQRSNAATDVVQTASVVALAYAASNAPQVWLCRSLAPRVEHDKFAAVCLPASVHAC